MVKGADTKKKATEKSKQVEKSVDASIEEPKEDQPDQTLELDQQPENENEDEEDKQAEVEKVDTEEPEDDNYSDQSFAESEKDHGQSLDRVDVSTVMKPS